MRFGKARCESGGVVWSGLVAGSYQIELPQGTSGAKWRHLAVAEGEQKVLPLHLPAGPKLAIEWVGDQPTTQFAMVRLGNMEMTAITMPGLFMGGSPAVADLVIPPGAEVWVCGGAGCCYDGDGGSPLRCEPDASIRPPSQED